MARLVVMATACMLLIGLGLNIKRIENTDNSAPPTPSPKPVKINYHAIVIGIDSYKDWPALGNARDEAMAVAEVLKNRYGFHVTQILDEKATEERINDTLRTALKKYDLDDALLIYFAGHGELTEEEGYWIPVDATRTEESGWIKNADLTYMLEASDVRQILVIANSCYSASIFGGKQVRRTGRPLPYVEYLNRISRYVIASGEEKVYDSGPEYSPFAEHLLRYLKNTTKQLFSASELAESIKTPYNEHTDKDIVHGQLVGPSQGRFIFAQRTAPQVQIGFVLDPNPEPIISEQAVEHVVQLHRSGHTNQASRLMDKIPTSTTTGSLARAVASHLLPEANRAHVQRLNDLIEYVQMQSASQDPKLQQTLREFAQPRIMVVLGPQDQTETRQGEDAATVWRFGLSSALGDVGGLRVIDRKNLENILTELKISGTQLSDERTRSLIGKLLPASLLVTGEYMVDGETERIFLRLLATDTTEILGAFEVSADDRQNRAKVIKRVTQDIHNRALYRRPLMAKVLRGENDILKAGAGEFHGVRLKTNFELIHRSRQSNVIFEEYRDRKVGNATVSYLGENTIDLEPKWGEEVPANEMKHLWVRELVTTSLEN